MIDTRYTVVVTLWNCGCGTQIYQDSRGTSQDFDGLSHLSDQRAHKNEEDSHREVLVEWYYERCEKDGS